MDRRIDERLRKPRRTKGTPFYIQRNYWAAGVILFGGFSWYLLDKSKISASEAESLSRFLVKKHNQTGMLSNIGHSSVETIEYSADHNKYSESPYKNLIKVRPEIILNDSANDAADFKSPVLTRKPKHLTSKLSKVPIQKSSSQSKVPVKKGQSKRGPTRSSKNSTIRTITDSFKYFGENPEHMQMAMALSKSAYEAECNSSDQSSPSEDVSNIADMLRNSKPTFLERFGFTSQRKLLNVENRRITTTSTETAKKNKSRFKYITPILNIRTHEERNSLIDSKISLILCQKNPQSKNLYKHDISSTILNNYVRKERSIFNLDSIYQESNFYVKCLDMPQNVYKCGYLLKDWNSIQGRDKSPCKTVKKDLNEEKQASHVDRHTELSESYSKTTDETARRITTPKRISQAETISKENSVKRIYEICQEASCSFNVSTGIPKKTSESYLESKSIVLPNLHTSLSKSPSHPFNLSRRSVSPDLFGSDDEISHASKNDIVEEEYSSFHIEENMQDFSESFVEKREHSVRDCQSKINSSNSSEESNVKSVLPNEIIDLTDGDDENVNTSPSKSLSFDIEIEAKTNDYFSSPQLRNQTCSSRSKVNIYNLDLFENDDHNHNTMKPSPEINGYSEDVSSGQKGEDVKSLNRETGNSQTRCSNSFNNEELKVPTTIEAANSVDNTSSDVEIINDHPEFFGQSIDNTNYFNESPNKNNAKNSSCTSDDSKPENSVIAIDDSSSDSHILDVLHEEEVKIKHGNSPDDIPQRDPEYKMMSSNKNDTDINAQRNHSYKINNQNSSVEETPKRCMKSLCFDEPVFYDSAELDVTDYVSNMLNQQNFSFDKTGRRNDAELEDGIVENEEIISLSQRSQSSVIVDEELNYSSHFATPLRINDEVENKMVCSDYGNTEKLEDMMPLSPELQEHSCSEAPAPKNISVATKQIPTPNNFIIKTNNVTPMPQYDNMSTPLITKELHKFGVKPLKRIRGAKLLTYIYESTHPIVGSREIVTDISESDEDTRVIKRRKKSNEGQTLNTWECNNSLSIMNALISCDNFVCASSIEVVGDRLTDNEKPEELIFERKQLTKISSCKVPLQIAWHNLVSSHQEIKENILLYEPLQLESLHMMLKEQGFKFHIQDLLTFLDKKCITIRTAQKQGKMHR